MASEISLQRTVGFRAAVILGAVIFFLLLAVGGERIFARRALAWEQAMAHAAHARFVLHSTVRDKVAAGTPLQQALDIAVRAARADEMHTAPSCVFVLTESGEELARSGFLPDGEGAYKVTVEAALEEDWPRSEMLTAQAEVIDAARLELPAAATGGQRVAMAIVVPAAVGFFDLLPLVVPGVLMAALAAAVVGLCILLGARRLVFRPLHAMAMQAERLGRGEAAELPTRYTRPDGDEVQRVGWALREMHRSLQQAAEEARAQAARVRVLLRSTAEAIFGLDTEGRCTFANPACARVLGYESSDALIGQPMLTLLAPEVEDAAMRARLSGALSRGTPLNRRLHLEHVKLRCAAGQTLDAELWVSPMETPGLAGDRVVTFLDRSAMRAAERERHANEARYRAIVESQQDVVVRWTPEGRIVFCNDAGCAFFCLEAEAAQDAYWPAHMPPEDRDEAIAFARAFAHNPRPMRIETRGGGRVVDWFVAPMFDEHGSLREVQSVGRDITALKQAEQEHLALESRVQQAQRLESLAVLAGGVAHDFNNRLMGILGNAELAATHVAGNEAALNHLHEIEESAQQAAELVRQLLAYVGHGNASVAPLDLSDLAESMRELLHITVSKEAHLHTDFKHPLPLVLADAVQIRQLLVNLATNASEALGEQSGTITVRTGDARYEDDNLPGNVFDGTFEQGHYAYIEVTDTGAGIESHLLPRIFDPFFSTKFAGRGLGLAAAMGIVRRHHGAIAVESEPGQGARFRVLFPVADSAKALPAPPPTPEQAETLRAGGRALVVDDEPIVRNILGGMLEELGFAVDYAADGAEALALYDERGAVWRVILLDILMPRMDGHEVLQALSERECPVPVIVTSGYAAEASLALRTGSRAFLQKPYTIQHLQATLLEVLSAGQQD